MYFAVPMMTSDCVRSDSGFFASPKSMTLVFVVLREQDVRRLDVAVDDAVAPRGLERQPHGFADLEDVLHRELAALPDIEA
jgi:hypothetical protein